MPQFLELKAKGLWTHPNPLAEVPPGAMLVADNMVIDREGIAETRRGLKRYGSALTLSAGQRPNKLFEYKDRLILHYGTTLAYDSDNAGTWTGYSGTYSPPTGAQAIRSVQANQNFYFTSSAGIKKLDAYNGTVSQAGGLKALDGSGATTGSTGWMTNNTQVAYRILFGITDANGNKIVGTPSERIIVTNNSGGTRDVALTFTLPGGITTSHFYQLYRSGMSGGVAVEPNDELQLVVEKSPTAGEVTAKLVTYTDQTPESLRGATLYTSPSQEGIAQANEPPPLARDIAFYKGHVLYANTISKHRLNITLISVGGTGLVNDDTITIAGTVYTGKATETAASGQFKITSTGNPASDIDATARSLVSVVNRYATNTLVYAYYVTGYNDLPGQILIEERSIGGAAFVAISSRGGAFSPPLPSAGSTYVSSNETRKNRVYIAKNQQPEAVPLLNYLDFGSADEDIIRIIALRDSVFVLKTDGIYRITGETINDFRETLFDSTTTLLAEETAVAFNNQVFMFSDQAVVAVSESGVQIMSRQIESDLLQLTGLTNFSTTAWAIGYESDRKYILGTITVSGDTYTTQLWVFNAITVTWTRWPLSRSCGWVLSRDDKMYLGSADPLSKYVYQERKNYVPSDNADEELAVTIVGSVNAIVELSSTTGLVVGWQLAQLNGNVVQRSSKILTIVDSSHVIVDDILSWAAGAATAYAPIAETVTYAPIHGGNPGIMKHFSYIEAMFSNVAFDELTMSFTSDVSISVDDVMLSPQREGPWGTFPWGSVAWGGASARIQPIPTLVPLEKARCQWLNITMEHSQALSKFALTGLSLTFEPTSVRRR